MAHEEHVPLLLEIICFQLDKEEAKRLLAISNHDVQTAVQKFYDTDIDTLRNVLRDSQAAWDDSAFAAGRYGDHDAALPTFNIAYAPGYENYPHSNGHSRAPTRPPSRTSQHSALSTRAGDAPMQSIEAPQESGVVGNINAAFGPANRAHYDPSQWAIVPTATEVIADAYPSQRQRENGQPAILKPSPNFNYLPALIPILHSIPQFRNALLSPGVVDTDYWVGQDWWKGVASPSARIIDETKGLAETHGLDILYETQRLMAFLDNTDRIYGSIDALLDMDAWKESHPPGLEDSDDDLLKFLLLWSFAFQAQVPNANLNGALRSVVDVAGQQAENFVLNGNVMRTSSWQNLSVYDALDDALFSGSSGTAHLADISNVLILRLTSSRTDASDLGCRVPATLYADRYMERNKHVIDEMNSDIKQFETKLDSISSQVQRLKYHTPNKQGAKRVESLKLLETSMKAYQPPADDSESTPEDVAVLAQLRDLHENIERKLGTLEEQAQQIRTMRDSIAARFKPIVNDDVDVMMGSASTDFPMGQSPQDAMHYPYKLWGVATRRDVVYLLHPDMTSDVPHARQWWRMQYDTETAHPTILRDRLSLQDVLERAASESASVLLVYANEEATSSDPMPLPTALEQFVKKDNLNFLEELQKDSTAWEAFGDQYSTSVPENWKKSGYDYRNDDWNNVSAQEFHVQCDVGRVDDSMSSATLTPNTEIDDVDEKRFDVEGNEVVMQEMVEISGSDGVKRRRESSETIGEMDGVKHEKIEPKLIDVEMDDVKEVPSVLQRVGVAQRKGG